MNFNRKYFASILLLFALIAVNGAEFFHHHHPGEINVKEDKCEACILHQTLHSAAVDQVYVFTPQIVLFSIISSDVNAVVITGDIASSLGRAPPAASHI